MDPEPQPAPQPQPQPPAQIAPAPRQRTRAAIIILFLLLSAATGYAGYEYGRRQPSAPAAAPVSAEPSSELLTLPLGLDHTPIPGAGLASVPAEFTIRVPSDWRAQVSSGFIRERFGCRDEAGLTPFLCGQLKFADVLGEPVSLRGGNEISVYALTDWMKRDTTPGPGDNPWPFAGLGTPEEKKRAVGAVRELTKTSELTPETIRALFNPHTGNAARGGVSDITYIESADGTFKGYSYIATFAQQAAYFPRAYTVMIGEIDGILTAVTGDFTINDKKKAELARISAERGFDAPALQEFFDSYKDGHQYGDDTLAQHARVLAAFRSIKAAPVPAAQDAAKDPAQKQE